MGAGGTTRGTNLRNALTAIDKLAALDMEFARMRVYGSVMTRVLDDHHLPVVAKPPAMNDLSGLRCSNPGARPAS